MQIQRQKLKNLGIATLCQLPWFAALIGMGAMIFDSRLNNWWLHLLCAAFILSYSIALLFWTRVPVGEKTFSPFMLAFGALISAVLPFLVLGAVVAIVARHRINSEFLFWPSSLFFVCLSIYLTSLGLRIKTMKTQRTLSLTSIVVLICAALPFALLIRIPCFNDTACMIKHDKQAEASLMVTAKLKSHVENYINKQDIFKTDIGKVQNLYIVDHYQQGFLDTITTLEVRIDGDAGAGTLVYKLDGFCSPLAYTCTWENDHGQKRFVFNDDDKTGNFSFEPERE